MNDVIMATQHIHNALKRKFHFSYIQFKVQLNAFTEKSNIDTLQKKKQPGMQYATCVGLYMVI